MNEQEFRQQTRTEGFGEPTNKEWPPQFDDVFHTHDKHVMLLVTSGTLTVCMEDREVVCEQGDCFELVAHTSHYEKTGEDGATTLIALQ